VKGTALFYSIGIDCSTPILTTYGWTSINRLVVGDSVFNAAGTPVPIVAITEPAPALETYRVTLTDGRSLITGADHVWEVLQANMGYTTRLKSVRQLLDQPISYSRTRKAADGNPSSVYRWRIRNQEGIHYFPTANLPLDPYIFGYWLGDGDSRTAKVIVSVNDADSFRTHLASAGMYVISDNAPTLQPNVRLIQFSTSPNRRSRGSAASRLRSIGVLQNKHIPDPYLTASHGQRLALLRGLMDSDGSPDRTAPKSEFTSTKRQLAQGVMTLARSLGYLPRISEGEARLEDRYISQRWRVTMNPTEKDQNIYLLERKAMLVRRSTRQKRPSIRSIEPVPNVWTRQITSEQPHQTILAGRDFIPVLID
jgi:LAGLIDADG-like domain